MLEYITYFLILGFCIIHLLGFAVGIFTDNRIFASIHGTTLLLLLFLLLK